MKKQCWSIFFFGLYYCSVIPPENVWINWQVNATTPLDRVCLYWTLYALIIAFVEKRPIDKGHGEKQLSIYLYISTRNNRGSLMLGPLAIRCNL